MRTNRGTLETLRWPAPERYGVSRSPKGLQTASAKSMMRHRSQTDFRSLSPEREEIGRISRYMAGNSATLSPAVRCARSALFAGSVHQKYQRIAASPDPLLMQRSQRRLPFRPTRIDRMVALAAVICPSFGRCA
jgi:hypothetical protein